MTAPTDPVYTREELRARLAGKFDAEGLRHGSVNGHRSLATVEPSSRRRCHCGCGKRATHNGLGDGLALMTGCEMSVRRWVRDGYTKGEDTQ